jgi:DNA-binding MarR family transcriptional regulator
MALSRQSFGFLLAKALQRWNATLEGQFAAAGFGYVRASFGSVLVPLFEEDGLRMRNLADRSRLSKQTMTTMVRLVESAALVERRDDPEDGRAVRVYLTKTAQRFRPVAEAALAEIEREFLGTGPIAEGNIVRRRLAAYARL